VRLFHVPDRPLLDDVTLASVMDLQRGVEEVAAVTMLQTCGDRFVDAAIGAHEVATRAERQPEQIHASPTHGGESYQATRDAGARTGESTRIGKRRPALRAALPLPHRGTSNRAGSDAEVATEGRLAAEPSKRSAGVWSYVLGTGTAGVREELNMGVLRGLGRAVGGLLAGVFGLLRGVLQGAGRLLRRLV
jgi:hypothetical protein